MNSEIIQLLRSNTQEIMDFVSLIDAGLAKAIPPSGGWSIIQNCDHLMSIDFGTYSLLASKGKAPDPNRESLIKSISLVATDRTKKVVAPAQVAPKGKTDTIEKFTAKFPTLREKIITRIANKDLNMVCDIFPHFVFGFMTFEEWIRFSTLHAQRHVLQMKEILEEMV